MSWRLDGTRADVQFGDFAAQVDLESPSQGVCHIRYQGSDFAGAQVLRVIPSDGATDRRESPSDCHVRGKDLIALYDEAGDDPVSREIYWRTLSDEGSDICGLELWLSAETQLLDSDPHLASGTRLPPCELSHLASGDTGGLTEIDTRQRGHVMLTRDTSTGVLLFRPVGVPWSYCEMVHPADFDRYAINTFEDGRIEITSSFFSRERLEKGVIRRTRVRGLFVARGDDVAQAVEAYRQFAASQLPLTT